jgi:nucleotide-binding universal stress UspA family protein
MFGKVLFPTDFSEKAKTELSCLTSIPGIREIILFHVIKHLAIPMGAEIIEDLAAQSVKVYLTEAKTYIKTLNPSIRVTLEETTSTDIPGSILEKAEEHHADLIIIHGNIKTILACTLLSCVSTKVLCRTSKINIMIIPDRLVKDLDGKIYEKFCPMIFSRILCPTDFSDLSLKAVALAGTMRSAGEIILLHVAEEGVSGDAATAAEVQIRAACDNLIKQGVRARTVVVTGKPDAGILRIAQREDVSLIWMSTAAKGCLYDFFYGSLVHDVIMNAARPVIVIRPDQ